MWRHAQLNGSGMDEAQQHMASIKETIYIVLGVKKGVKIRANNVASLSIVGWWWSGHSSAASTISVIVVVIATAATMASPHGHHRCLRHHSSVVTAIHHYVVLAITTLGVTLTVVNSVVVFAVTVVVVLAVIAIGSVLTPLLAHKRTGVTFHPEPHLTSTNSCSTTELYQQEWVTAIRTEGEDPTNLLYYEKDPGWQGLSDTVGDNGEDMRNTGSKEEEEIQEVKLRDISETGVLLIHFQGAFKLSLESETYHKVNNEAKVKRGQKSINWWLKHTTPGRIKPQAQSDNPSETRNHTVHEADPITIQAQAHLDPSGASLDRVTCQGHVTGA
ncbi:hypothetical protein EDB87DRAFT_1827135 [Lactarius vividus]|nr:hypothetical protein EDB87DRAFT_1827135 [Lactarius vividus]